LAFELSANLFSNPPADAAALNSINLQYERNLAAHTSLDDIVKRAELLDVLGGTTLAKTLIPLLKLDMLRQALADEIQAQDRHSGSLVLPGDEAAGGQRGTSVVVVAEEGSITPRARTQPLPPQGRPGDAFPALSNGSSWPELAPSRPAQEDGTLRRPRITESRFSAPLSLSCSRTYPPFPE